MSTLILSSQCYYVIILTLIRKLLLINTSIFVISNFKVKVKIMKWNFGMNEMKIKWKPKLVNGNYNNEIISTSTKPTTLKSIA